MIQSPKDAEAYYYRGLAYHELGQIKRGIQDYDEAIRLNPEDNDYFRNRGLAFYELG